MRALIGIVLGLATTAASPVAAQSDKEAVLQVVKRLFDGMRTRDTALMRAQFDPSARMLGVDAKGSTPKVQVMDPNGWIGAVGKGTGPAWDERIFDPVVEVDDNLAHVWTYYEFWLGEKLSHCGYDSFTLTKLGSQWKVTQVADTRRASCSPRR